MSKKKSAEDHGKQEQEAPGRRWSLAYLDVTEPPLDLVEKHGHVITELDLSYNRIADLRFLAGLPRLKSLVLDHNQVTSQVKIPDLPNMHTLWLNHNKVKNLGMFVSTLAAHCPNLRYLSMMNNEAAPSYFNGGSYQQYADFRHYVISRLPKLEVLDYQPVTTTERSEAVRIYGVGLPDRKRHKRTRPNLEQSAKF